MANYGIPYMGSKDSIVHKICSIFPAAENFYDLFGGGFSVSHFMILHKSQKYKKIFYNEIKTDIVDLIRRAIGGEFNYENFKPKWITKEEFNLKKDNDSYIRCLWSFGNNQKDYLFSEENERLKKSLHNAVVFNEFDNIALDILKIKSFPSNLSIRGRRLISRSIVINRMQQLERLERLQQLEQLERLEQLELISKSYEQVKILPNSIIYCDPPYKGTTNYIVCFDHEKFWDWVRIQKFPVFISEYDAPKDIKTIMVINKKTRLSCKGMTDTKPEKLFGNDLAHSLILGE